MAHFTLASLMSALDNFSDSDLAEPVEILALLARQRSNALADVHLGQDRTAYLYLRTAAADPVVFYAESVTDDAPLDHGYLSYGMLRAVGRRLGWQAREDSPRIESSCTMQKFTIALRPEGWCGRLIIAREEPEVSGALRARVSELSV